MNDEQRTMNDIERRDLVKRTKMFALRIIKLYVSLPKTTQAQVIGKQVLRSGTSVGAHYREAKRARSTAEFVSKIEGALQELDETIYWLELICESQIVPESRLTSLKTEAEELMRMLVSSAKTAKKHR
jgi:four helix bundle protein